jgi:predicted methyltransferase
VAALLLLACAGPGGPMSGSVSPAGPSARAIAAPAPLSRERIAEIVASPDRSAADRTNDQRRKPADMLAFIGVRPGSTVLDLSAGGGYTTELLARAVGPAGHVYGQSAPRDPSRAVRPRRRVPMPRARRVQVRVRADLPRRPPARVRAEPRQRPAPIVGETAASSGGPAPAASAPPAPRTSATALAERARKPATPNITAVVQRFEDPVPAALAGGAVDLATLMFNYHDLGHLGVDRAAMNAAVFRALKPGGVYVIADHCGPARHRHLRIRHLAPRRGGVRAARGRGGRLQVGRFGRLLAEPRRTRATGTCRSRRSRRTSSC